MQRIMRVRAGRAGNCGAQPARWSDGHAHGLDFQAPIHYTSGSVKYLVGVAKATAVRALAVREPEAHPGSLVKPVVVAIRLHRRDVDLFTPLRTN
jgi:hypothetical protein